jgi:hypothetical protein
LPPAGKHPKLDRPYEHQRIASRKPAVIGLVRFFRRAGSHRGGGARHAALGDLCPEKKSPYRRHRHHHASYRERFRKNADEIRQLVQPRRRQRREHHPLNPTLAQTGGLPPAREEDKSAGQPPPAAQL